MIAVRATHSRRPIGSRRIIGIPWSILTTRSCRTIPSFGGKGQALLEFASSSPVSNPDVLMTYIKDATMQGQWDGALYADSSPTRMLLGSAAPKLLAEATRTIDMTIAELTEPWTETATVECRMTTTAKGGTAVIQLPTMAGRTSFLLHTDGDGSATKGALFALHWYPDLTERDVPRRFCALGRGELTGFTVPVGGEATASGAATGFDRDSIAKSGRTSLVGSSSIDLWIVR
jgi:hypothetical protein